ncbi:hypothetical protein GYB22_13905 [bacterium]|nr:hypothetical protein [bacterium]
MRCPYLILLLLVSGMLKAQVKEVNFLGKSWFLHGYDIRYSGNIVDPKLHTEISNLIEFPTQEYQDYIHSEMDNAYSIRNAILPYRAFSFGLVFRPFQQSKINWIQQFEFSHNVEVEHINLFIDAKSLNTSFAYRALDLTYTPRFMVSSPTFADYLKIYATGELRFTSPIRSFLYVEVPDDIIPNKSKISSDRLKGYDDRLSNSYLISGAGIGGGIKMNVTCNWNVHLEGAHYRLMATRLSKDYKSFNSMTQIRLGIRYKFGIPEETEEKEKKEPSVFW